MRRKISKMNGNKNVADLNMDKHRYQRNKPPIGSIMYFRAYAHGGLSVRRLSIMEFQQAANGNTDAGSAGDHRNSLTGEDTDLEIIQQRREDALTPLKEDLAEWLNKTLGIVCFKYIC